MEKIVEFNPVSYMCNCCMYGALDVNVWLARGIRDLTTRVATANRW